MMGKKLALRNLTMDRRLRQSELKFLIKPCA